jgi:hypothetical protein
MTYITSCYVELSTFKAGSFISRAANNFHGGISPKGGVRLIFEHFRLLNVGGHAYLCCRN